MSETYKYMVISWSCCSEHGDTDHDYFDTLEEARKFATRGDTILKIIEKVK